MLPPFYFVHLSFSNFHCFVFSFDQGALGVAHLIENGWNGSIKWKSVTVAMKMEHQVENRCKLKDCNENN